MRPIRITATNAARIDNAIKTACSGRFYVHGYRYADIQSLARQAEQQLRDTIGSGEHCKDAHYMAESGRKLPRSYKYSRKTVVVILRRGKRDWYLAAVQSSQLWPDKNGQSRLVLTDQQQQKRFAA